MSSDVAGRVDLKEDRIMFDRTTLGATFIGTLFAGLVSITGAASPQRTFVSTGGSDGNPCSITAPCRGFAAAVAAVAAGGEVIILDSGGYGPVTITQPVSIIAPPGIFAGVSVFSGTGIFVDAGTGVVVLSGLTINGLGGQWGIRYSSGAMLRLNAISVSGFPGPGGAGLLTYLGAPGSLFIRDSTFERNGTGAKIESTGAPGAVVTVGIENSHFDQNGAGAEFVDSVVGVVTASTFSANTEGVMVHAFNAGQVSHVTLRNCVISGNGNGGLTAGWPGSTSVVAITDSEISDNKNIGVRAQEASFVTLSNTTVTRNGIGIYSAYGGLVSYQDNRLDLNTTNGTFTGAFTKK
jgi:hypothetical protein